MVRRLNKISMWMSLAAMLSLGFLSPIAIIVGMMDVYAMPTKLAKRYLTISIVSFLACLLLFASISYVYVNLYLPGKDAARKFRYYSKIERSIPTQVIVIDQLYGEDPHLPTKSELEQNIQDEMDDCDIKYTLLSSQTYELKNYGYDGKENTDDDIVVTVDMKKQSIAIRKPKDDNAIRSTSKLISDFNEIYDEFKIIEVD